MPRQSDLSFAFAPASGAAFDVVSFRLEEAISRPYLLTVELSSTDPSVDFGTLLNQSGILMIRRGDTDVRYVHGIPRIGQEVIVAFPDGDTDQPVVIGRAYNALNPAPYELPRHKTRMTIKSQTHKGEGYNELRFEDEKDQEEIYVHAQKDQNIHVNHDETTFIGHDRRENVEHDEMIDVGHDRTESVGNDEQVSIGHDRRHTIGQDAFLNIQRNHSINIGKDRIEQVGNHRKDQTTANHIIDVGGHVEATAQGHHKLSAGQSIERQTQKYQLQASQNVVIRGPGGTITIDSAGVTIEGIAIRLKGPVTNPGSGAGNGFAFDGSPNAGEVINCVEKNQ